MRQFNMLFILLLFVITCSGKQPYKHTINFNNQVYKLIGQDNSTVLFIKHEYIPVSVSESNFTKSITVFNWYGAQSASEIIEPIFEDMKPYLYQKPLVHHLNNINDKEDIVAEFIVLEKENKHISYSLHRCRASQDKRVTSIVFIVKISYDGDINKLKSIIKNEIQPNRSIWLKEISNLNI